MHGSFLVKLLRFCISSTEEAKMKKKTIYVVIAIAVVAILAIGFQTAPKTPAFDFESNTQIRTFLLDWTYGCLP